MKLGRFRSGQAVWYYTDTQWERGIIAPPKRNDYGPARARVNIGGIEYLVYNLDCVRTEEEQAQLLLAA